MRRGVGGLAAIGTLVIVPLAAACGGGDTAGPERSVAIGDVQERQYFYQGEYLGRTVTVSAAVSEVFGPLSFELSGGDIGDDPVLVVTSESVAVEEDQLVRVTGTVGQLHRTFPSDRIPYVQTDLYTTHDTEGYLFDATVKPLTS